MALRICWYDHLIPAYGRECGILHSLRHVLTHEGVMSFQKEDEREYRVIQMPMVGNIRSYHKDGLSNRELFLRRKHHEECVRQEFRL